MTTQTPFQELFEAGAHYGAARSRRHPSSKKFVFGVKNTLEIVDLEKTTAQLAVAKEFIQGLGALGKVVLFVGNKSEAHKAIKDGATRASMPFVAGRWIGGTLTNFDQIKKRVARLAELEAKEASGELAVYTKKERSLLGFEMADLTKTFGGIRTMEQLPAALVAIDSAREHIAVTEARKMNIPVIALTNTDCDNALVDYAIIANDRSASSIKYFTDALVDAYLAGRSAKN